MPLNGTYAGKRRGRMETNKAAIYCRLSEEDRDKRLSSDDSGSIQNQKAMLLQYAAEQGWEVYHIYSDDDYAGSDRSRPAFQQLLRDAQAGRFNIILCKTQSRFTRELELVEKYIHGLFPLWGIRFVSIVDNADTDNRGNKKSRQINGLVNEWYLEDMSENIRSVLDSRRKNGLHIGAFALYGYRKDPDRKGHLLVDEEAAATVRQVFVLFAQGYGKTAIARYLNSQGIPTPGEYKRLHGMAYRNPRESAGTLWTYSAVSSMLHNEIYIGNLVQGKYGSVSYKSRKNRPRPKSAWFVSEGTHEAIIDRPLWDRVQALLLERSRPFASGQTGIFARKVRCMSCGGTMRSSKSRGRHYLQCRNRYVDHSACPGAFVPVRLLEEIVLKEIKRLSEEYMDREALARAISLQDPLAVRRKALEEVIAARKKKLAEYTSALRSLYLDRARGILSEDGFLPLLTELNQSRARLEAEAQRDENRLKRLSSHGHVESPSERLERCLNPDRLTRDMVEQLIDYIAVGRRAPGAKAPPIEIHWKF